MHTDTRVSNPQHFNVGGNGKKTSSGCEAPSTRWRGGRSGSEQEVSDKGEQLCQLSLDVVRLSDGVAAEIKMLQLGAGGQWLKICQGGDFWTSELKRNPHSRNVG